MPGSSITVRFLVSVEEYILTGWFYGHLERFQALVDTRVAQTCMHVSEDSSARLSLQIQHR